MYTSYAKEPCLPLQPPLPRPRIAPRRGPIGQWQVHLKTLQIWSKKVLLKFVTQNGYTITIIYPGFQIRGAHRLFLHKFEILS